MMKAYINRFLGREISGLARFCDRVVQLMPTVADQGALLKAVENTQKSQVSDIGQLELEPNKTTLYVMNGNLNHSLDIQSLLEPVCDVMTRSDRLCLVLYNPYMRWVYRLANRLGVRKGPLPQTFITRIDLQHILHLAGFRVVRTRNAIYSPWRLWGIGEGINRLLSIVPLVRWLGLTYVVYCQAIPKAPQKPSFSIIVPARNEEGHIAQTLSRLPNFDCSLEVIFIEGHSRDNTWQAISTLIHSYKGPIQLKAYQQTGKGKNDAVRLGFEKATGEVVTILDGDLTTPPEQMKQFYDAYASGKADCINGSRFVYPMENDATPWLNYWVNHAFAWLLSWVLDISVGDTLCGTKLLRKKDYERIQEWREYFGDVDPFGDFDLLCGASALCLGVSDVPIRYLARQYGQTNIAYFSSGFSLLKTTMVAFWKIKLGFRHDAAK